MNNKLGTLPHPASALGGPPLCMPRKGTGPMIRTLNRYVLIGILGLATTSSAGCASPKLRALIIDGQSNHDWAATTTYVNLALLDSGRFTVDVATTPTKKAPPEAWLAFRPDFSKYDVVLSNYNNYYPSGTGSRWPQEVEKALETYVTDGGGLVVIHAANNAFPHWPAWNRMVGLCWRKKDFGDRLAFDDAGNLIRTPAGEGLNSRHGDVHQYRVRIRDPQHPITKGLPTEWMHAEDELYHAQRGPQAYDSRNTWHLQPPRCDENPPVSPLY